MMRRTSKDKISRSGTARIMLVGALLLLGATPTIAARLGADYFPNAPLVNQDGKTLRFYDDVIKGKVVAINFMFTSCGDSCPLETAKLRQVQQLLGDHVGKDVHMYSISIDPERDTPAVLKAYMERFDVGPGWQFLTGSQKDIDLIRKKLGMFRDEETDLSEHNTSYIMGNEAAGQWVKRTPYDDTQSLVAVLLGRLQKHALASSMPRQSYAKVARLPSTTRGEDLFRTRCTACHTIGHGDGLGPDLLGVVDAREPAWLNRFLKEPDVMLAEKDPLAQTLLARYNNVAMPNLKLTDVDIQNLVEYMRTEDQRLSAAAEQ